MKVAIFGASGRTGRKLIQQALDRGLDVIAYARDSKKIDIEDPRLVKISGGLSNREILRTAIEGSDCVLSALGPMGKPSDRELSDGIANILSIMEECGVKRFIALSTTSAQDSQDKESLNTRLRRGMIRRGRPISYEQIVLYSQLIRNSNSDWTLVRIASILTDKPLSKQVSSGYLGRGRFSNKLSRSNLAWFMLEQLNSTEHLRKAPALSD